MQNTLRSGALGLVTSIVILIGGFCVGGCSTAPATQAERDVLVRRAEDTIERFRQEDSGLDHFFSSSVAYAVFPTVAKGAVGIGGAHGQGVLYEAGTMTGYCDLTQGSIGFQLGGQGYSEIIFFRSKRAVGNFKRGTFEFAAQASAVAVHAGASADANYEAGVAVFTMPKSGLMYEASIGGQSFDFVPASAADGN